MQTAKVLMMEPEHVALIREGAGLKNEIDSKTKRLREINKQLAELAEYKAGSKTGSLVGAGYKVKVQLKETISWDQDKLDDTRQCLGDEVFFKVFKWKFEPQSKKDLDGFLEYADEKYRSPILGAMTVKPAQPQVKYERLED